MLRPRVIPCMLLKNEALVKTVRFEKGKYIGDPVNVMQLFSDLGADEVLLLDIDAHRKNLGPDFALIERIASEAFMPVAYGGGIRNLEDAARVLRSGVEKVVLNSAAFENPTLVTQIAGRFGSQAVAVSLDVRKKLLGYSVCIRGGTQSLKGTPESWAQEMEKAGAGELILHSIDREGTWSGYDLELIRKISEQVSIPLIACGGASQISDLRQAVNEAGASAAAAGSLFVFHGKDLGVLVNFPSETELERIFA